MDRRHFLRSALAGTILACISPEEATAAMSSNHTGNILNIDSTAKFETDVPGLREFLESKVIPREYVDYYLKRKNKCWSKFDPELAYVPKGATLYGGVDGSLVSMSYGRHGERRMLNWANRLCRINTYGDSFTEGIQVSDGETWQEALAAHLGEPIRNFGVGGYGVYQAYRRMLRMERIVPAEYVILNIFVDDHFRNLHKMRGILWKMFPDAFSVEASLMFHATPWVHLEIIAETGEIVELENEYRTPESLYKLCDKEHVYQAFKDDFTVQIVMASLTGRFSHPEKMKALCKAMGIEGNIDDPDECRKLVPVLHQKCALKSTIYTIDRAAEFCRNAGSKLMVMLSSDDFAVHAACKGLPRWDQPVLDHLRKTGITMIDGIQKHVDDFGAFNQTPEQYTTRYYSGHYRPSGNQFYAFAAKNEIVEWLDPKPPMYRRLEL